MGKQSAGLLMYRFREGRPEFLLVHPGGPFWARKDLGAWSIPKGEFSPPEDPLETAKREFEEETGFPIGDDFLPLAPRKQPSGKVISVWAFEGDCDPERMKSNTFSMEWPKGSGTMREFPEVDRAGWFDIESAREKILAGQRPFLDELVDRLRGGAADAKTKRKTNPPRPKPERK